MYIPTGSLNKSDNERILNIVHWVLFPGTGYHELYNGVICNDTILATGVFSSKELWMLSKGTTLYLS